MELHKLSDQRRRRRRRKPLYCEVSERASLSGCLYFFQCDFSLSLPPNLSLPHSAEESASSKDTRVDSRKSGCCRSDKNLVGVSVWVEPVEEQRWLHHSSLGTWHTPSAMLSKRQRVWKQATHAQRHTQLLRGYTHILAMLHKHRYRHRERQWQCCNSKTTVV